MTITLEMKYIYVRLQCKNIRPKLWFFFFFFFIWGLRQLVKGYNLGTIFFKYSIVSSPIN
jgi:hypothetical protein